MVSSSKWHFSGCGKGSVDTTIPEGGENIRKVELGADLAKSNPLFMGIEIRKWKIETVFIKKKDWDCDYTN